MGDTDVQLIRNASTPASTLLAVLNGAYQTDRFTQDWLEWKHRSGPWGPSTPLLARSAEGELGVVFSLPWHFRFGNKEIAGARFVDGGTTPLARRRGVFRRLITSELDAWDERGDAGMLMATATPAAQASHVKTGAVALPPISYGYGPPPVGRRARLDSGDHLLDTYRPHGDRLGTAWTETSLRWRIDPRSGHEYEVAGLASSDGPTGLVFRAVGRHPARVLVPLVVWGSQREQQQLLWNVARSRRCVAVLAPVGEGAEKVPGWRPLRRGEVHVCIWDRRESSGADSDAARLANWDLGAADVEGLI